MQRWFATLDAFDPDNPPAWADGLDWWGRNDGLDKWHAYDIPGIHSKTPGLILGVVNTEHHIRGVWNITGAAPPSDVELLKFASDRAGTINQWNDSWFDRVAADGLIRINRRTGFSLDPISIAIDLLWLLSPLVAVDAWRHRHHWPSRVGDTTKCPKCRYDRSGLALDASCPECGHASF